MSTKKMSTRSLFGGQAPEFKIDGAAPGATEDGYPMAWDEAAGVVGFSAQPVTASTTTSSGAVVSILEGGGAGEFATIWQTTTGQRINAAGDQLVTVTVQGGTGDVNLTGGTTTLNIVLPADLAADGANVNVCGVAAVTDTVAQYLCMVYVSGTAMDIKLPSGFAAGAWSILSFTATYIHPA